MINKRTSFEPIGTTPSSERRALELLGYLSQIHRGRSVVAIAGESGSGKSTTSVSLMLELQKKGLHALILHLDNYFRDIPEVNTQKRKEDFENVGISEINIARLQEHVNAFVHGEAQIEVPVLSGDRKSFTENLLELKEVDILIVEGTFVFELENIDLRIFLDLNYEKSRARRISRGRDAVDEFSERVLKKEHALISPYGDTADILVDEDGNLSSSLSQS